MSVYGGVLLMRAPVRYNDVIYQLNLQYLTDLIHISSDGDITLRWFRYS